MRGKLSRRLEDGLGVVDPSMRPAHYAREVRLTQRNVLGDGIPSMRPAHYAREVGMPLVLMSRLLSLQ